MRGVMCAVTALGLASSLILASCSASPSREAEAEAEKVWKTLISKCGELYYIKVGEDIYEMKGMTYRVEVDPITEAEKMNGIQARVHARATCAVHRWYNGYTTRWSEWRDGGVAAMPFFSLIKRNGAWSFNYRPNESTAFDCSKIPR